MIVEGHDLHQWRNKMMSSEYLPSAYLNEHFFRAIWHAETYKQFEDRAISDFLHYIAKYGIDDYDSTHEAFKNFWEELPKFWKWWVFLTYNDDEDGEIHVESEKSSVVE